MGLDDASLERIGCGCELIEPPPACLNLIRAMIEDFLADREPRAAG